MNNMYDKDFRFVNIIPTIRTKMSIIMLILVSVCKMDLILPDTRIAFNVSQVLK